jgi:hypothetical protein
MRRGLREYFIGLSGARPWRCRSCELRFFGWVVPVAYARYAHCGQCGNLDLQHIASDHVQDGSFAWLGRKLDLPAYRCERCRNRFFSVRPHRQIRAVPRDAHHPGATSQHATPSS